MNDELTCNAAFRCVMGAQAICVALSTAELLVSRELTAQAGFHSLRRLSDLGESAKWLTRLQRILPLILVFRLAAAVSLVGAAIVDVFVPAAVLALCALSLLLAWYKIIGGDGAEQMSLIVITAASMTVLTGMGELELLVFHGFVAGQAALSYFTAGTAKMLSPTWRSGGAITKIVAASSYGTRTTYRVLTAAPSLSSILCWATIIWEMAFPLSLLGVKEITLTLLVLGVGFHVGCAIVMGLNDFIWAFVGTYPAILVIASRIGERLW